LTIKMLRSVAQSLQNFMNL